MEALKSYSDMFQDLRKPGENAKWNLFIEIGIHNL